MGVFGNYTGQALPNVQALQAARVAVVEGALESQQRVREAIATLPFNTGGNGLIINIMV